MKRFLSRLFDRAKAIETLAPGSFWRSRSRAGSGGYEGASTGRRANGWGSMKNPQAAAQAARGPLADRARYLVANNGHAAAAKAAWVAALIGTGIVPAIAGPHATRFLAWTDEADADGVADFYGLQALTAAGTVVDGESFILMINTAAGLRLRALNPEQVDGTLTRPTLNGGQIVAGVEFDAAGSRIAYHIRPARHDLGLGQPLTPVRVPAEDVIHLYRVDFAGQVRGISWFAPALLRLAEHDEWHGAQLTRQKVGALLAGFVTTQDGVVPFAGETEGETVVASMEPGALLVLPPGKDVRFSDPPAISAEANEFARISLHEIAAALGLPYEVLTGDLSAVNYSSIRAGLVEWRRRVEMIQHNVIVFQMLRPIWRRWLTLEILAGRIDGRLEDLLPVRWITPKQQWVDPAKDVKAEIDAIGAGLMSRREAVASRGLDIDALDAEIAVDQARAKALGLTFTAGAAKAAPAHVEPETEGAAA